MKVAELTRYGAGNNIRLSERETPIPKANEVLIRVVSTTVNSADWRLRTLSVPAGYGPMVRLYMGLFRPRKKILGTECAGQVVAVGKNVTRFQHGDEVIAFTGSRLGAHAEYLAIGESMPIVRKPACLSWDEAAALCFGGTTAVDFLLNKGGLRAGESVLINGASGVVGCAAIQIAHHAGAQVTAVCRGDAAEQAKRLGADHVIDYQADDFTTLNQQWDVIFDAVGNANWPKVRPRLRPDGRLLMVVASLPASLHALWAKGEQGQRCVPGTAREHQEDLQLLAGLAVSGDYRPQIQAVYPFAEIQQAHEALENGHKRGSIVVRVSAPTPG